MEHAANPIESPIYPRRPLLYAKLLDIIQTEHADQAVLAIADMVPRKSHHDIAAIIREVTRRSYVDGLRDGFVQGVEHAAETEEAARQ